VTEEWGVQVTVVELKDIQLVEISVDKNSTVSSRRR
jgi:hypothetical protein